MNSQRTIIVSIFLGLAPLLIGCGKGKGVERLPLHGTVTLANGERPSGSISFLPAKGQSGPSATAKLANGSYQFDRSNGPAAGPHTVKVKRIVPRSSVMESLAKKQPIAKTQSEWTSSADVANDGQYLQDFDLKD